MNAEEAAREYQNSAQVSAAWGTRVVELRDPDMLLGMIERLWTAIRKHRDQRGDDRCYLDDRELYAVLPEGYVPPPHDTAVTLEQCAHFIRCRQDPATEYVSSQRRIEELEKLVASLSCRVEEQKELLEKSAEKPGARSCTRDKI